MTMKIAVSIISLLVITACDTSNNKLTRDQAAQVLSERHRADLSGTEAQLGVLVVPGGTHGTMKLSCAWTDCTTLDRLIERDAGNAETLKALQAKGFITLTTLSFEPITRMSSASAVIKVEIPAGTKDLKSVKMAGFDNMNQLVARVANFEKVIITGLVETEKGRAQVEYEVQLKPTALGADLKPHIRNFDGQYPLTRKSMAEFAKYDDGWRLVGQ